MICRRVHFSCFVHNSYCQHISDESVDKEQNVRVIESIFQVIGIILNVPRNALTFSLYIVCDGRVVQL